MRNVPKPQLKFQTRIACELYNFVGLLLKIRRRGNDLVFGVIAYVLPQGGAVVTTMNVSLT